MLDTATARSVSRLVTLSPFGAWALPLLASKQHRGGGQLRTRLGHRLRLAALVSVLFLVGCTTGESGPTEAQAEQLESEVLRDREQAVHRIRGFAPQDRGQLDDLNTPVVNLLRQLPGVADVEVLVPAAKPTARIIHLPGLSSPHDATFREIEEVLAGRRLTDRQASLLYRVRRMRARQVQLEQGVLLALLAEHHGLPPVLAMELSHDGLPAYRELMSVFKDTDPEHAAFNRLNGAVRDAKGQLKVSPPHSRPVIDTCYKIVHLSEAEVAARAEVRQDELVKQLLTWPTALILTVEGDPALTSSVRKLGGGTTEYIRVTPKRFQQFAER